MYLLEFKTYTLQLQIFNYLIMQNVVFLSVPFPSQKEKIGNATDLEFEHVNF